MGWKQTCPVVKVLSQAAAALNSPVGVRNSIRWIPATLKERVGLRATVMLIGAS